MGFSSWAGQRRTCMTFFGPSMTEKIVVEVRPMKIVGEAERCSVVCVFLSYACVVRAVSL